MRRTRPASHVQKVSECILLSVWDPGRVQRDIDSDSALKLTLTILEAPVFGEAEGREAFPAGGQRRSGRS